MIIQKEEIQYENRIVAFVDILGFKEIIINSETDTSQLKIIYESLSFLKTREKPNEWDLQLIEIEEDAQQRGVEEFNITEKTVCSCFSDSIVVSAKVDGDNANEVVSALVANLSFIGAKLITEGILLRGAITSGNLIHKDNGLIMGKALIDAYKLESAVAKYPRIIISQALIRDLNYPLTSKKDRYPYHQYLFRFRDGCVGFHQMTYFQVLQSWKGLEDASLRTGLKNVKQTIINGLDASFEQPEVYGKYEWLKMEYEKLIILEEGFKEKFYELNENIVGQNIHYSYTDNFYYPEK